MHSYVSALVLHEQDTHPLQCSSLTDFGIADSPESKRSSSLDG